MENVITGIKEMSAILENYMRIVSINWVNMFGIARRWEAVRRVMKNKETNKYGFDDIVVVVPITDEGEIIFISQFRATVAAVFAGDEKLIDESRYQVIEFPAGVVDDQGKNKTETALSELAEEAGLGTQELQVINEGAISAGLSFEYVTEYLARDVFAVEKTGGDEQSKITVHKVSLNSATEWLEERKREGYVIDSRVIPLVSLVKEIIKGEE